MAERATLPPCAISVNYTAKLCALSAPLIKAAAEPVNTGACHADERVLTGERDVGPPGWLRVTVDFSNSLGLLACIVAPRLPSELRQGG